MPTDELDIRYVETDGERVIVYQREGRRVEIASPLEGYGMLVVRTEEGEIERYYGLEMAVDHVAELLGVPIRSVPVPAVAEDMGI